MDPWSWVDYSRHIREASMEMEGLPEVNPPSGRVPGQSLLTTQILKRRQRQNREGIGKKGSAPRVFGVRVIYRRRGHPGGHQGVQAPPGRSPTLGRATRAPGPLVAPLGSPIDYSGSFRSADFLYIFPGIFLAFYVIGKPEIKRQQKTETGTGVH